MKEAFDKRLREAMALRGYKQVDLVQKTGLSKSAVNHYVSGKYEAKQKALFLLAEALDVSEGWLMGYDVPMEKSATCAYPDNILKIEVRKIPVLGTIAAGKPIYAEEEYDSYIAAGSDIEADFCLKVKGDSMINARIYDGDVVFIKQQDTVDEGEIAAVLIDDEATLKRVYQNNGNIMLVAENPNYKPIVFKPEDGKSIRILGKAIAFQGQIV